ncbi:MAG TPA: hypothetical protein VMM18_00710 [Gemmatimonadaceae bacterium]|nr:hypothetical protein [Gemmatimonadaceae bacterium]
MSDTSARLADELKPFLEAVAHAVAYGLGADALEPGGERRKADASRRAVEILRAAGALDTPVDAGALDAAARRLLDDRALLAAFFQNLDLLYQHRAPRADVVSRLLMRVMEL